jgi:hypothetical protein
MVISSGTSEDLLAWFLLTVGVECSGVREVPQPVASRISGTVRRVTTASSPCSMWGERCSGGGQSWSNRPAASMTHCPHGDRPWNYGLAKLTRQTRTRTGKVGSGPGKTAGQPS